MFLNKFYSFDNLVTSWQKVWESLPEKLPFDSFYWTYTWYKIFPDGKPILFKLTDEKHTPFGFAAFKLIDNNVYWLAGEEVTDYEDLICEDKYKEEFWNLIIKDWQENKINQVILRNLPQNSISGKILKDISQKNKFELQEEKEDVVPYIQLPATYEDYLSNLSRKDRHELRRKWRRFENEANHNWQLVKSTLKSHDTDCHHFFTIFRQNGEAKRLFLTPPMEDFFCQITSEMQKNDLLDFSSLIIKNEIIAQTISFVNANTLYLYNMAVNPNYYQLSPGIILNKLLIEESIEKKRRVYDFMRGNERYKYQLGAKDEFVYKITIKF